MHLLKSIKERSEILRSEIIALYLAYGDRRTPWPPKLFVILTVAYALSPVDLIPDFIPVLGYLDDLIILPLLITLSIKLLPAEVLSECRIKAKENNGISRKIGIYAALFVLILWAAIAFAILKCLV